MQRVCFYHAGCPDGFGAAWAAWKAWGDTADYRPRGHDDPLDAAELTDREVVFADIAPPLSALRQLGARARRVVVLDHHLTAWERFAADPELERELRARGHLVRFDLERCGAVLAWQHFHPAEPVPTLLRYIEDMDLWIWSLPHSEAVNAALAAYARRFEVWDRLAKEPIERLAEQGEPILRAQRIEIDRALQNAHPVSLATWRIEAVNATFHRSLIGHELAQRRAFGLPVGVVYRVQGRRVDVSIYSTGDFDVSRIAAEHGGGGHRNAAGFHVSLVDWLERFA